MNAGGLREHVGTDDRLVEGDPPPGKHLHPLTGGNQLGLVDVRAAPEEVVDPHYRLIQRGVAGAFAHAIDGAVHTGGAGFHGGQRVRGGHAVVVVAVKVEAQARVAAHQAAYETADLRRRQQAQGVGQHDAPQIHAAQLVEHRQHVVGRVEHAPRPVLQVDVAAHAVVAGILDRGADIGEVFGRLLAELGRDVQQRALGEQVHHRTAQLRDPVDRAVHVGKAEHFDGVGPAMLLRPGDHLADGAALAFADQRTGQFDVVHLHVFEQHLGDGQLLAGRVAHVLHLLPVTQGSVEDFDWRQGGHRSNPPAANRRRQPTKKAVSVVPTACNRREPPRHGGRG